MDDPEEGHIMTLTYAHMFDEHQMRRAVMNTVTAPQRFGPAIQILHWLTAALVIALLVMGNVADIHADEPGSALFIWHGSLGVLVLMLTLLRVLSRAGRQQPALPAAMGTVERGVAAATHLAFYILLLALPISGWLLASAEGAPVSVFGMFSLPSIGIVGKGKEFFEELHEVFANVVLVLVALHVLAALKHHFVSRDDVLRRMLPMFGRPLRDR